MLTWRSIRAAHRAAGSVNQLMAPWGFVDDQTFITKSGDVGLVYRLRDIDYEGLEDGERQLLVHRFEAGLRTINASCWVYQHVLRRGADLHGQPRHALDLFLGGDVRRDGADAAAVDAPALASRHHRAARGGH